MDNMGRSYIFPTWNLSFLFQKERFLTFECSNMFSNIFDLLVVQGC